MSARTWLVAVAVGMLVAARGFAGDDPAKAMTDRQAAADSVAMAGGTAPVRVTAGADGVAAGVDLLQAKEAPGFVARNWGKILTGAVAGGAGYLAVARNNDMWPYKKSGGDSAAAAGNSSSPTRTSTSTVSDSHGSPTVVVSGNSAPVNVTVGVNTGTQAPATP